MSLRSSFWGQTAHKAVSLLCVAQVFLLTVLAASPVLHQHVHHDADKADHHCAVTMLAAGKIHVASNETEIVRTFSGVTVSLWTPVSVIIAVDYQLLPGRAPPFLIG
jgi:hypothetical protein